MIRTSLIAQGKRRLLLSLLLAVLVAIVYFYLARSYQGRVTEWILAIGWVLVVLNFLRAGLGLLYRLDQQPFRRLDFGLEDDRVSPGRCLQMELAIEARRPTRLSLLAVELKCRRLETDRPSRRETVLYQQEKRIVEDSSFDPDECRRLQVEVQVPEDAPFSYRDFQGRIRWSLLVVAEVSGWGVLRDEFDLTVSPS
jgi:hypothetical protein